MKATAAMLIAVCAATAGLSVSVRLKMRERELRIFLQALLALKNAAAYTLGDLHTLLEMCRENELLGGVREILRQSEHMSCTEAFEKAAHAFFTSARDEALCAEFIRGFGKTDLDGQLAYFALYESRVRGALESAERDFAQKGKLYVFLGLFFGTSAAFILL